jgi:hypothetical protein
MAKDMQNMDLPHFDMAKIKDLQNMHKYVKFGKSK